MSEEYRIVTSLQSEVICPVSDGTMLKASLNSDLVDEQLAPKKETDFIEETTAVIASGRKVLSINPVYDASDFTGEEFHHIVNGHHVNGDICNSPEVDLEGYKNGRSGNEKHLIEEKHTVTVEDEEVEMRSPSNHENKFRESRPPTWRRNQNFVSEAFSFLKELDNGDTNSVIVTDNVDHVCEEFHDGCCKCSLSHPTNKGINHQDFGSQKDQSETQTQKADENVFIEENIGRKTNNKGPEENHEEAIFNGDAVSDEKLNGELTLDQVDTVGDLPPCRKLGRKRDDHSGKDDDGGSSDEDTGVYRESFRKSTWLYIGENKEIKQEKNIANYISLADLGLETCDDEDSIFGESVESPSNELPSFPTSPNSTHKRNESTTTTASEHEFRRQYNSVSRRVVQRKDSQQQYKRFTTKCYDITKTVVLHRDPSREFGIHILDSSPAIISGVDAGSPAEGAGLKEGQIVISVNGVNVLQAKHVEIIELVHMNPASLTVELGSGDMSGVLDLQEPVITGYLKKQVSSTILRTWKRRYFILRKDDCLYYYKTDKDTDPLGAIPLNGYTVSRYGDVHKFGFRAERYSSRTFYFMAETREDMTNWVGHLNEAAQRGFNKDSWMDVTAQNVGLPALNIRSPDCSGYLFKIGRATRRWRKRYCVLKDACIYYYKNASSKEAEGVAHLHGYTVLDSGAYGKKHSFSLQPPESQMRTFSFYTDNDTDKDRWVKALSTSIKKWIKVD